MALAAFSSAPYPDVGWTPYIALILACTRRDSPFHLLPARPQPFGIMAFAQVQYRFCARARALALHPKKVSACPEVGGLSTPAKGSPAAAALPLSRPGRIREDIIKTFANGQWKIEAGRSQKIPPRVQDPSIFQTEKLSKLTVTFPPPQTVVPAISPTFPSGKLSST
jgi:hypothetical protein